MTKEKTEYPLTPKEIKALLHVHYQKQAALDMADVVIAKLVAIQKQETPIWIGIAKRLDLKLSDRWKVDFVKGTVCKKEIE